MRRRCLSRVKAFFCEKTNSRERPTDRRAAKSRQTRCSCKGHHQQQQHRQRRRRRRRRHSRRAVHCKAITSCSTTAAAATADDKDRAQTINARTFVVKNDVCMRPFVRSCDYTYQPSTTLTNISRNAFAVQFAKTLHPSPSLSLSNTRTRRNTRYAYVTPPTACPCKLNALKTGQRLAASLMLSPPFSKPR